MKSIIKKKKESRELCSMSSKLKKENPTSLTHYQKRFWYRRTAKPYHDEKRLIKSFANLNRNY